MDERQVQNLVRWNRFWLALCVLFALVKGREAVQSYYQERILPNKPSDVRTVWATQGLLIGSMSGGVVITHLMGKSNGELVVAPLPRPPFVLGSSTARLTPAEFRQLPWVTPPGVRSPAPPLRSEIIPLSSQVEGRDWIRFIYGER
jgi:hypothetical protein